ncbi:MAG: MlaD family protein [Gammaproteobacteria bacterium]|nr:MlaD family protein [Gammaproteobacteria bacterium]
MDTKVNYIIVGLFMAILTLAIIGATIWLAGIHSTHRYNTYVTYMDEAVTGLSEKAPIKFNGVEVGFVDKINLNPQNPQQVRLLLKIQERTPINEATRSSLLVQGLTGIAFVGLTAEKTHAPILKIKPGEMYPVIQSKPSLLFRLDQTVQSMSENITSVAKNLNDVMSDENKSSLKGSLKNLQEITATFEKNSQNIDDTLRSLNKLIDNSAKASDKLPALMTQLETSLKAGKQSMQSLSQQTLPAADQMILKFKRSLDNIEELTDELSKNPSMLIRGKAPVAKGPGEK